MNSKLLWNKLFWKHCHDRTPLSKITIKYKTFEQLLLFLFLFNYVCTWIHCLWAKSNSIFFLCFKIWFSRDFWKFYILFFKKWLIYYIYQPKNIIYIWINVFLWNNNFNQIHFLLLNNDKKKMLDGLLNGLNSQPDPEVKETLLISYNRILVCIFFNLFKSLYFIGS